MYKAEPGVLYPEELSFITGGNGALCGIYMEFGQEYLIDLVRDDFDGELHAVGLCGAFRPWSSVTELDLYHLEGGCEDDACGSYSYCFEFQVCSNTTVCSIDKYMYDVVLYIKYWYYTRGMIPGIIQYNAQYLWGGITNTAGAVIPALRSRFDCSS